MRIKMADVLARSIALVCLSMVVVTVTGQDLIRVEPPQIVTTAGQNVSMVCTVPWPINSCRMTILGKTYILSPENNNGGDNIVYFGAGFQSGQCGIAVKRVEENMNGEIKCAVPPSRGSVEVEGVARLIIAKPPDQILMNVNPGRKGPTTYEVGDTFVAQCIVRHSRPQAILRWFLEGPGIQQQIHNGLHTPQIVEEQNSDLVTTAQNLSRTLTADDHGLTITCLAEHEALQRPLRATRQLDVQYAPLPREDPIYIFGIHVGSTALVNVTVRANPEPKVEWIINGNRVQQGTSDNSGRFEAMNPVLIGNGYYNITMRISSILQEDTETIYTLQARNEVNLQQYRIRISNLEAPMSMALDTGSIIGIVVAVLIIILAIVIVVFAKATDRWCFGARPSEEEKEPHPKPSGESSDTESAVGGPKHQSQERKIKLELPAFAKQWPAQLRAKLPGRNKDRVTDVEIETKATNEDDKDGEKKSIVYAELALTQSPETPKNQPESTEYAEIQIGMESKKDDASKQV